MAKKKLSYREAIIEIENIIKEIDTDDLDLDEMQVKLKRFKMLMADCKEKLRNAEADIENLMSDQD